MTIYDSFGVRTIINAKGTATRLSGGIMRAEVAEAMRQASQHCVDIAELQAAASQEIAKATGAEAGYVASGASACLLLAAAACLAGLDPGRMARLPETSGMPNEIIMVRSQRNFYDHAIRAAGAKIIEVGLPDRFAGAGVRDAEIWEIEDAVSERTAAIFYVADALALPPLPAISALAKRRNISMIVDAAAQLPPASNLKRFVAEGADLVAYSGGKVLGGPQASGILCGRKDLIMSAALQHLDLDIYDDMWAPPPQLIDRNKLKGTPQHGIGRSCKAGKEEIVGVLTALRLFTAETDDARHKNWMAILEDIAGNLESPSHHYVTIEGANDPRAIPLLVIQCQGRTSLASDIIKKLISGSPSIHTDPFRRAANQIIINPVCLHPVDTKVVAAKIKQLLSA